MLDDALKALTRERILVCKEDLEARGVQHGGIVAVSNDFYERLVEDILLDENRIYTF